MTRKNTVTLKQGRKIVARQTVGESAPPPRASWQRVRDPHAHFSADKAYVWHFGYADALPMITLLDGKTLEVLGTYAPRRLPFYDETGDSFPLEDWGEDFSLEISGEPAGVIIYANAGDDPLMLHTLEASPEGIIDRAGLKLLEHIRHLLDARIFNATRVGPDHLAILGDVNDVYLMSWPEGIKQAAAHLEIPDGTLCDYLSARGAVLEVAYISEEDYEPAGELYLDARTLKPVSAPDTAE